jgi:hypothetical protein
MLTCCLINRYKMTYFEPSARVPLLVHYPKLFKPHRVPENVSTLDILPTLVDMAGTKLLPGLPMDGTSLLPQLRGRSGSDTVFGEYCGEGTIAPLMMIRRGQWKFVICPADSPQLYNLEDDPLELRNLASGQKVKDSSEAIEQILDDFTKEAHAKWDFEKIAEDVRRSQHRRRFIWKALKQGKFTSWDYNPPDDAREKYAFAPSPLHLSHAYPLWRYIRSHVPLDDLELRARFPPVDAYGRETFPFRHDQAGSHGQ